MEEKLEGLNMYLVAIVAGVLITIGTLYYLSNFVYSFLDKNFSAPVSELLTTIYNDLMLFVVPLVVPFAILYRSNKELRWAILGALVSLAVTLLVFLLLVARARARYGFP